jgi:uroporphyrinogen-III synthase
VRIALTQGHGRLEGLAEELSALGYEIVRAPLVQTAFRDDGATRAAAGALLGLPWRAYPSRSAVEAWRALGLPFDDGAHLAAVGPATARALVDAGGEVALVADPATGDALVAALADAAERGAAIGVPQGSSARPHLVRGLREAGFDVRVAVVYDTHKRPWGGTLPVDAVVLASPSAVAELPQEVGERAVVVAIGPTTAEAAAQRGFAPLVAAEPTVPALVELLAEGRAARAAGPAVPPWRDPS